MISNHWLLKPAGALTAILVVGAGLLPAASADEIQPITQLKKLHLDTALARGGEATAVIYHPASTGYATVAEALRQQIKEAHGIDLPVKPDDAQQTWRREKVNVVVLGHFGNSRLLRWLRARALVATHSGSGVSPLSIKRRLRTIHDPWGEGRNVVMLGGIDVENVKANFPSLLRRLRTPQPGTVLLPPTLEPKRELSDSLRARIDGFRKELDGLPINYPAYRAGWVCKHYPSLGHEEFVPLYLESLQRLVREKAYNHLYLFRECRAWDLIEESPALTDADRLLITNFFRETVADEKQGIGSLRKLLKRNALIQGNHQSQTACGIMVMADYLRRYYSSELHEKWYGEALAFFERYRTKGSYLGDDEVMQGSSISNIMNAVWQTEGDPSTHPFLKMVLKRLMPNYNNFGTFPMYGDMAHPSRFGAGFYSQGASLYTSPEFLWMSHFIRTASSQAPPKISTEKAGPGWEPLEFPPRQPDGFVGLQWAEPDETLYSMARPKWIKENGIAMQDCFGRCAFRAGINPQDDYLLLDGVHLGHAYDDQNGFLEYSALGRTFLVSLDYGYGTKLSAHNVVAVSVDGMADCYPALLAVRRLWADLPSFAATRTVLYPDGRADWQRLYYPSADWERNVLWLKNRFFVVFDRVIAKRDGMHSAVGFWRMVGERHDVPDGVEMLHCPGDKEVRFRLVAHGVDQIAVGEEEDPQGTYLFERYSAGPIMPSMAGVPPVIHVLKAHKARPLKAGESFTMTTCFWARSAERATDLTCQAIADNALRLRLNQQYMLASRGPISLPGLLVDAELSLLGSETVCLVAGRKLMIGTEVLLEADAPVSLEWDVVRGQCDVIADSAGRLTLNGTSLNVPKGKSIHRVSTERGGKLLAAVLEGLPVATCAVPKLHPPPALEKLRIVSRREGEQAVHSLWAGQLHPGQVTLLVGRANGALDALDGESLEPRWTYHCERTVNSIAAGDLDGDGTFEVAAGSDDHHLHALTRDGKSLWKWQPPFDWQKAKIAYCQWLWPEPFVKKAAIRDLDKDGKADIFVGGGMNTFAVNGEGKQLWAFRDSKGHCPSMQTCVFLDVNGDGIEEPVFGASDVWYVSCMWAVDPTGKQLLQYGSDGWCSGARVAVAEDLVGNGKKSLVYGTRQGGIWVYPDPADLGRKWYRRFADQVDHLTTLKWENGKRLIVCAGGDTQWVTAFAPDGSKVWAVYTDSAVAAMVAGASEDRLYIVCDDGTVRDIGADGKLRSSVELPGRPVTAVAHPEDGVFVGMAGGTVSLARQGEDSQ